MPKKSIKDKEKHLHELQFKKQAAEIGIKAVQAIPDFYGAAFYYANLKRRHSFSEIFNFFGNELSQSEIAVNNLLPDKKINWDKSLQSLEGQSKKQDLKKLFYTNTVGK